jgi:DNA replication protein DnaC
MGKKKENKKATALYAVLKHFQGHEFSELVSYKRSFPGTARADLQVVLDNLMSGARLLGLCRQWANEALKFSDLLDQRHVPVMVGPVQYDEIEVGDAEPMRCLHQGIWLIPGGLAALLSQPPEHSRATGPVLEIVAAPEPESLKSATELLKQLEVAVAEAGTYRGKVLSLEAEDSYRGTLGRVRVHRIPSIAREEVVLPAKTLELLERNVHEFIQQREALRGMNMTLKKGLLFYGPPGTGKTHTIRYLASQLPGHTTFLITAEQVGKLSQYLQFARFLQPAIVVIEDVDLIARDRRRQGACEEVLLNQLLNEMDGLREESEILFILTSNRPEDLEAALASRPGRIDQAIEFPLPDEPGRAQLLQLYSGNLKMTKTLIKEVVKRTQGASAAFIKELMRRSAQNLLREGSSLDLDPHHLRGALEEMVFQGGSLNLRLLGAENLATSN